MESFTYPISGNTTHSITVPQEISGMRLDAFVTKQFPGYSRSFFQQLITDNHILVNNKSAKASTLVKAGDTVQVHFPQPKTISYTPTPEAQALLKNMPVEIIFEHPHFLIVNKPAQLVVHKPSSKSTAITLVDWLVNRIASIAHVGREDRPGIVHRLDKDTSGLMIVTRTNYAHALFTTMFKERTIQKTYLAVVQGHPNQKDTIDFPIGRDPFAPTKMSHAGIRSRQALTNYEVITYFEHAALVKAKPVTGRTHQIRVHFAAIGFPLIGDELYGKKSNLISRHALHAFSLAFTFDGQEFYFEQEVPEDFKKLLAQLPPLTQ